MFMRKCEWGLRQHLRYILLQHKMVAQSYENTQAHCDEQKVCYEALVLYSEVVVEPALDFGAQNYCIATSKAILSATMMVRWDVYW